MRKWMPVGVSRVRPGDIGTFGTSSDRLLWTLACASLYVNRERRNRVLDIWLKFSRILPLDYEILGPLR